MYQDTQSLELLFPDGSRMFFDLILSNPVAMFDIDFIQSNSPTQKCCQHVPLVASIYAVFPTLRGIGGQIKF